MMTLNKTFLYTLLLLFLSAVSLSFFQSLNPNSSTASPSLLKNKAGVGLIYLSGPIHFDTYGSSYFNSGSVESILDQLVAIEENDAVKALVIRINSPGGTVGASQEVYAAIRRLKEKRNIPIIASIGDIGTSGAYYSAIASDKIFANAGSMVGSIGVILGNVNFSELAKNYGIDFMVYKSGQYKDILSSWREPSVQEQKMLQAVVDNVHEQFVSSVIERRNLAKNIAKDITQGQFFTGQQALKMGLIDQLGGLDDAINDAAKHAGLKGKPVIITEPSFPFYDMIDMWKNQLFSLKRLGLHHPSLELR